MTIAMVQYVATQEEFEGLVMCPSLVVVEFCASWAPPSQRVGPALEAMAEESEMADVTFVRVDVDANTSTTAACTVKCLPTIQFFKNGELHGKIEGVDERGIRALVAKHK